MILFVTLSISGCFNMYNEADEDMGNEYRFYLAVSANTYVYIFSMDSNSNITLVDRFACGGYPSGNGKYMAAHPNGNFLYVGDYASNSILMYSVSSDGRIAPLTPSSISFSGTPGQLVIHPMGNSLFLNNNNGSSNVLYKYIINADGTLSSTPSSTTTALTSRKRIAMDPSGEFIYVLTPQVGSNNYIEKFRTSDLTSVGSVTFLIPNVSYTSWDLKIHPNNQYIYVVAEDGIRTYTTSLQYVDIYAIGVSNSAVLTFNTNGKYLYCSQSFQVTSFALNSNGTLSNQGSVTGSSSSYFDAVFSPSSNCLFIAIYGPTAARVDSYSLDSNGLAVSRSTIYTGTNDDLYGLAIIKKKIK